MIDRLGLHRRAVQGGHQNSGDGAGGRAHFDVVGGAVHTQGQGFGDQLMVWMYSLYSAPLASGRVYNSRWRAISGAHSTLAMLVNVCSTA